MKRIIRIFEDGNVLVTGLRGRGKDMLMANVACRRKKPYVSNVKYDDTYFIPYNSKDFDCGNNTYRNFVSGDVNYYEFPFQDGTDLYLSDVGVYYPSQYCNELNKEFKSVPTFMSLSRQLSNSNVFTNCQNINRIWDKIREQSDSYITCVWCKVIFGIVFQKVIYYDKYTSCEQRVKPFNVSNFIFDNSISRSLVNLERARFEQTYGIVKPMFLIYRNKSNYDTRLFKEMLANGKKN